MRGCSDGQKRRETAPLLRRSAGAPDWQIGRSADTPMVTEQIGRYRDAQTAVADVVDAGDRGRIIPRMQ
jgi:hypothetical protein